MRRTASLRLLGAFTVAAVSAGVLSAPPSSASIGWDDGTFVVPTGTAFEQDARLAVDADGNRQVVFSSDFDIELVEIQADGTPEPPVRIFSSGEAGGIHPQLAVDASGRITVVWQANGPGKAKVMSRTVGADGTVGALRTLSDPDETSYDPQIVVDSQGVVTVVWPVEGGYRVGDDVLRMRRLDATGAPLGPRVTLDAPAATAPEFGLIREPRLAVDAEDRVTVAWSRTEDADDGSFSIHARRIAADGTPGPVQLVSDGGDTRYPQVAIAPDSTATVAWTRFDESPTTIEVNRLAADDGTPGTPRTVSDPADTAWDDAAVTVDPQGRVTVAWHSDLADGAGYVVETRRIRAEGTLEPPREPVGPAAVTNARFEMIGLAADGSGRVTVAYVGDDPSGSRVHAVRLAEDGTPSTTGRLSSPGSAFDFGEVLEVGVDTQGAASALWTRGGAAVVRSALPPALGPVAADTRFLTGPADDSATTDRTPTFEFEANTVQATMECRLNRGAWTPCVSPYTTRELRFRTHTLRVRATDADGTPADATPAIRRFTVEPTAECRRAKRRLADARHALRVAEQSDKPRAIRRAEQGVRQAKRDVRREC